MANLAYVRGTTFNLTVNFFPPDGAPAGATALFTVKNETDDDLTDLTNSIMTPKNISMADNSCIVKLSPGDVSMAHPSGSGYVWDVKIIDAAGDIWPGSSGKFSLDVTATNRITA